ncbi:GNAT family N-acetyltransferase [Candidatus Bipolaricaulota bacterium]|nr:GNAT family N-acetyltransferase [Candidatus Bipolaricaulota bacterium]
MDASMDYRVPRMDEYEWFFSMMKEKTGAYLEPTLIAMGLDWSCLRDMVCAVGEVRAIDREGIPVGFVWIEKRGSRLHVHGLVIDPVYRGRGIGSSVLRDLEHEFAAQVDSIELGVHDSNQRARSLYERLGFELQETRPDAGFLVFRKSLRRSESSAAQWCKEV